MPQRPRILANQRVKRPKGTFKRVVKRAAVGAVALAAAGSIGYGAFRHAAKENAARNAFFSGKTRNVPAWVKASKDLGISSRALSSLRSLSPETMRAVEKEAEKLGMKQDGVRRVIETVARYSDKGYDKISEEFGNYVAGGVSDAEVARAHRITSVIYWFEKLPESQRRELGALASKYEIPTRY